MADYYESRHTGQIIDDAVDRAKVGGAIDIALQNKAPAGYGLGELSGKKLTASDNIDNIRVSGIYTYSWNPSNQPSGLPAEAQYHDGLLIVIAGAQNAVEQKIIFVKGSPTANTGDNCTVHRLSLGTSAWQPWEWVNPPMNLGVEYRTTERYLGKPVYVRLHDFGALPNNTFKEDSSPASWSIDKAICAYGTTSDGITIPTQNYAGMITDGRRVSMYFMRTELTIATDANRTNTSATIFLKYTKTTD